MKRIVIFFIVFNWVNVLFCQERIDKYFYDGGLSNRKNIIQTELISFFKPSIPIIYERFLNRRTSIVGGISILNPNKNYRFFLVNSVVENAIYSNNLNFIPSLPYTFWVEPHRWFNAPNGIFVGAKYQFWSFKESRFNDFSVCVGRGYLIGKHLTISAKINSGIRLIRYLHYINPKLQSRNYVDTHSILIDFQVSIGYFF